MIDVIDQIPVETPDERMVRDQLASLGVVTDQQADLQALVKDVIDGGTRAKKKNGLAAGSFIIATGESGASKSFSFDSIAFNLFGQGAGVAPSPWLTMEAPAPCSVRALAGALLTACGYPVARRITTNIIVEKVESQIELVRPKVLFIDEAQELMHVTPSMSSTHEIDTDILRRILRKVVDRGTTVILCGLPHLNDFAEATPWVKTRVAATFEFQPLMLARDRSLGQATDLVTDIVKSCAEVAKVEVRVAELPSILARLVHATSGAFGITIEIIKAAVLLAYVQREPLGHAQFADVFELRTAVAPPENVFLAPEWWSLKTTLAHTGRTILPSSVVKPKRLAKVTPATPDDVRGKW